MSIDLMNAVWKTHGRFKGTTKLLLLALADQANDNGECWPSMATIAKRSECTDRHAQNIVAGLMADGVLSVKHRRGRSSIYTLHMDRIAGPPEPPRGEARLGGENSSGVKPSSPQGVKPSSGGGEAQFTPGVKPSSPRTTNESPPNPQDESPIPSGGKAAASAPRVEGDFTPSADAPERPASDSVAADVFDGEILDAEIVDNDEPPATAQTLVGHWIAHREALTGSRPTGRVIGHLSRELKALLDEGQPHDDVAAGLKLWDSKGLHPSCLASCVDEARGPVPKSRREQQRDAIFDAAMARADEPNPFMTAEENTIARGSYVARDATAAQRRAEVDACGQCDETGYRAGLPCSHDADQDERTKRGAAYARANLRKAPAIDLERTSA